MAAKTKAAKTPSAKKRPAGRARKSPRTAPHAPKPARPKVKATSPRGAAAAPAVPSRIIFSEVPWRAVAKGAREKSLERGGTKLRLLELLGTFEEPVWCLKGHAGVVLEGTLELLMDGGPARYSEGQGFLLLPGEDRHRATALTKRVLLFVVDFELPEEPFPRFY